MLFVAYRVPKPGSLPNDVELETVVCLKDDWRQSPLADKENATAAVPCPDDIIQFKFGPKTSRELFSVENGIHTLDLHGLTAEEAREMTRNFLRAHTNRLGNPLATGGMSFQQGSTLATGPSSEVKIVKIITGRGNNSQGGIPIVKPVVENILRQRNLKFTVTAKGGAFTVEL